MWPSHSVKQFITALRSERPVPVESYRSPALSHQVLQSADLAWHILLQICHADCLSFAACSCRAWSNLVHNKQLYQHLDGFRLLASNEWASTCDFQNQSTWFQLPSNLQRNKLLELVIPAAGRATPLQVIDIGGRITCNDWQIIQDRVCEAVRAGHLLEIVAVNDGGFWLLAQLLGTLLGQISSELTTFEPLEEFALPGPLKEFLHNCGLRRITVAYPPTQWHDAACKRTGRVTGTWPNYWLNLTKLMSEVCAMRDLEHLDLTNGSLIQRYSGKIDTNSLFLPRMNGPTLIDSFVNRLTNLKALKYLNLMGLTDGMTADNLLTLLRSLPSLQEISVYDENKTQFEVDQHLLAAREQGISAGVKNRNPFTISARDPSTCCCTRPHSGCLCYKQASAPSIAVHVATLGQLELKCLSTNIVLSLSEWQSIFSACPYLEELECFAADFSNIWELSPGCPRGPSRAEFIDLCASAGAKCKRLRKLKTAAFPNSWRRSTGYWPSAGELMQALAGLPLEELPMPLPKSLSENIISWVQCFPALHTLELNDCNVAQAKAISKHTVNLTSLKLFWNSTLSDHVIKHLHLPKLLDLELSCLDLVTDLSIVHFSKNSPGLEGLKIESCPRITDLTLNMIRQRAFKCIAYLDLTGNFSEAVAADLDEAIEEFMRIPQGDMWKVWADNPDANDCGTCDTFNDKPWTEEKSAAIAANSAKHLECSDCGVTPTHICGGLDQHNQCLEMSVHNQCLEGLDEIVLLEDHLKDLSCPVCSKLFCESCVAHRFLYCRPIGCYVCDACWETCRSVN